ncbi:MAG: translation initiation factor IF-2 [Paludibacter sp.]|nr:translation initiation factor IF-2 [Paludibacter sp.]MDD4199344.1 translation initiation factor IF-2 [Paludibacter sp.]MDD4429020.1 translation initiation factor IF-2 [Paludibacter sp.]
MPIRLSKACKELNIGITTAVDFLAKKGNKIAVDPNLKLSDELHLLLVKEFNKDMALKMESERISQERHQKEKSSTVALEGYGENIPADKAENIIPVEIPKDQIPSIKQVGKIDLDAKTRKVEPVAPEPVPVPVKKEPEHITEPVSEVEKSEVKDVEVPVVSNEEPTVADSRKSEEQAPVLEESKADEVQQPADSLRPEEVVVKTEKEIINENKVVDKVDVQEDHSEKIVDSDENSQENNEEELFSISIPVLDKTPVVLGKIDLDLINQTTRPKPKTKEQKKKEREEKARLAVESKKSFTEKEEDIKRKKKRERFSNQKVDIEHFPLDHGKKTTPGGSSMQAKLPKDKFKKPLKTVVDEEEVQRQIKETLARMAGSNKKGKGAKYRREKRESISARQSELEMQEREQEKVLKLTEFVTVSELAVMMDVSVNQVIATCMSIGVMVSINQRLDAETINIVADEFGFSTEFVSADVVEAIGEEEPDAAADLQPRAPIVTVMGHVDHGKTSLLDHIRKTNVIAGEAGGITQHIGAYNVRLDNGQRITFLDTPGHEAFTAMRARGAKVTDIAIIIVAADDNVMPQTVEAINHASAAGVPIVFAINKVDKPGANPDKIKETLANMNYLVEEWGGKYQSQDISAKQGTGVAELLEKVLLEAEMLELKANPNKRAVGSVIESSLDKGRGYISTVLVENGTLKMGDDVLAGIYHGRIKAMFNERNQRIQEAKPAEPVLILGLNGAPQAGDNFNVMTTEQEAREIANKREQLQREQSLRTKKHFTLDELGRRIALGDFKELNIIVKGDVDGSVEALADSLLGLSTTNIQVNVIHKAVGAISDSDVLLAAASNAIICGFQVRPTASARKMAEKEEIDVRLYSIIYDAIEEIKSAMEGMLSPEIKEEVTATVEVREVFKITKVGTIAGCLVREGKIKRTNKVHIIRDGIVIYTGELESLKRFKDDVKEVGTNYECGLNIKNYNDIQVGDIIESFEETEVKKTL